MKDKRSIDDLKILGAESPTTEDMLRLYDQAFLEFGACTMEQLQVCSTDVRGCAVDYAKFARGGEPIRAIDRGADRGSMPCLSLTFSRRSFVGWPPTATRRATGRKAPI